MATIEIKNVGPVKEAKFDLNKVNVFMGPQSSGKSTIAKIISYCTWLEKNVATSQSLTKYQENISLVKEELEAFHKIKGYFKMDSFILYKSDTIEMRFENGHTSLEWVDRYAYTRSKIAYMPSERNMVALPALEQVELSNTNIRRFLFDWFESRKRYTNQEKLSILDLGIDYYYSEENNEDHIKAENDKYDILLSNASSGLQSITPLITVIEYSVKWVYNIDKISFEQRTKQRKAINHIMDEKVLKPLFKLDSISTEERVEKIEQLNKLLENSDDKAREYVQLFFKLQRNITHTKKTQLIIEEPEQNLFPTTQRDLIYYMLRVMNESKRDHRLTFSTHSPYILYALNNCMMGYLIKDNIPEEERKELLSKNSWINPDLVSIWELVEGKDGSTIRSIKNSETGTVSKHYFNGVMNDVMEEYREMLTYLKPE